MSDGSQNRRTVLGLAWIVIVTALSAPGCAQVPVPRSNSNQVHIPPPRPTPTPTPVVATKAAEAPGRTDEGASLPPLPLAPDADPMGETLAAAALADAPTPLLDEALAKASAEQAEEDAILALSDEEEPTESRETMASVPPQVGGGGQAPRPQGPEPEPNPEPDPQARPEPDPKEDALSALADARFASRAAPVVIDPEKRVKPVDPGVLWSDGLARLRRIAGEQALASGTGVWTQRSRLLDILAEDGPKNDGTLDPTRPCRMALAVLGIPRDAMTIEEPLRGAEVRAAVDALEGEAPLEISDLRLCRKVNGFGNFDPLDTAACKAGQPLIIYCEMSGLHYSPAGELFHSRLTSRVELVPANGGEPVWAQSLGSAEDVCRRRRRDYYVNYRIVLAETIPPGVYDLRVVQKDEVAGRTTSASIPLTIQR